MDGCYGVTSWINACLAGFRMVGWDDVAIVNHAGLDPDILTKGYCSFDVYNDVLDAAEALYGKTACIDFRLGILPTSFNSLSLAMLSASSLFEALQLLHKHGKSTTNGVDFFISKGDEFFFGFKPVDKQALRPSVAISILVTVLKTARFIHSNGVTLKCVEVAHSERDFLSPPVNSKMDIPITDQNDIELARTANAILESYFKSPIKWGGDSYTLHFTSPASHEPSIYANHELMLKCEQSWLEEVASLEESKFLLSVQNFIRSNLDHESLSIELLAKEFGISVRTLQRRLGLESTNFKLTLETVRKLEAVRLIKQSKKNISEVAYMLGFSDVTNFSRAFRRWFDKTPEQFRKE